MLNYHLLEEISFSEKVILVSLLHLNEEQLFLLARLLSRHLKTEIEKVITAPYTNPTKFLLATSGMFKDKKFFSSAYNLYSTTINSLDYRDAILYKLKDFENLNNHGVINHLNINAKESDGTPTSRLYHPEWHSWDTNATWIFAQVEKKRNFVVASSLTESNIYRTSRNKNDYSALTKEMVCVLYKCNYSISKLEYYNNTLLTYMEKPKNNECRVALGNLSNISAYECEISVLLFNQLQFYHELILTMKNYVLKTENNTFFKNQNLTEKKRALAQEIIYSFSELIEKIKNKKTLLIQPIDDLIAKLNEFTLMHFSIVSKHSLFNFKHIDGRLGIALEKAKESLMFLKKMEFEFKVNSNVPGSETPSGEALLHK